MKRGSWSQPLVVFSVVQVLWLMSWPYGNVEREKYRGKTNLFFLKGSACTLWDVAQFRPVPTVSFRQKILSLLCNSLSCCEQEKHHTWRKTGFLTACFKLSNLLTWTSVEQLCILAQLHIFLMKKSFGKHLLVYTSNSWPAGRMKECNGHCTDLPLFSGF